MVQATKPGARLRQSGIRRSITIQPSPISSRADRSDSDNDNGTLPRNPESAELCNDIGENGEDPSDEEGQTVRITGGEVGRVVSDSPRPEM